MKRWIVAVLLSVLLSGPVVSQATDDTLDPGKTILFAVPLVKIPIDSVPDSGAKEKKAEGGAKYDPVKEKEKQDKKVDDAIKKAWEEK